MVTVAVQSNGFELTKKHTELLHRWEKFIDDNMNNVKCIEHFYYGDKLVMSTVVLNNGNYGHFNICGNRISFNGHTCTKEEYNIFASATLNDELFKGKL